MKRYFIKKDFIGWPLDIIVGIYKDNIWRGGDFLAPRKLSKGFTGFSSLQEILKYEYCKCGKSNCTFNQRLYEIVNQKISIDHSIVP